MSERRLPDELVEQFVRRMSGQGSEREHRDVVWAENPELAAQYEELEALWERLGNLRILPPPGIVPLPSRREAAPRLGSRSKSNSSCSGPADGGSRKPRSRSSFR